MLRSVGSVPRVPHFNLRGCWKCSKGAPFQSEGVLEAFQGCPILILGVLEVFRWCPMTFFGVLEVFRQWSISKSRPRTEVVRQRRRARE